MEVVTNPVDGHLSLLKVPITNIKLHPDVAGLWITSTRDNGQLRRNLAALNDYDVEGV